MTTTSDSDTIMRMAPSMRAGYCADLLRRLAHIIRLRASFVTAAYMAIGPSGWPRGQACGGRKNADRHKAGVTANATHLSCCWARRGSAYRCDISHQYHLYLLTGQVWSKAVASSGAT